MVATSHKSAQPDEPARSQGVATGSSPRTALPTMYDLPSESLEEPGLPDEFHDLQPQLLSRTLKLTGYSRQQYFTASDLNLYYDPTHPLWYKRADWFLAVDVPRLYDQWDLRRSYVVWQEPHAPHVVVEFLSVGTEADDLGRFHSKTTGENSEPNSAPVELQESLSEATEQGSPDKPPSKLTVYEEYLQIPHYLVYNRQTAQLRYFQIVEGQYQEQALNANNPLVWLDDLQIGLGIWQGEFDDAPVFWLRWCDRHGTWLLTDTEQAELAREVAEQQTRAAEQRAEQAERARAAAEQQMERERLAKEQERLAKEQERLAKEQAQNQLLQAARNLLAAGMAAEQVMAMLGLSAEQIEGLNTDDS